MTTEALKGELRIATVRVANWREAVRYYRDCVGLRQKFADQASEYAMFETGAVRLAVEGPAKPAVPRAEGSSAVLLNFEVADLAEALRCLRRNGATVQDEVRHGPGYDYLAVSDPEGNQHVIYQRTRA